MSNYVAPNVPVNVTWELIEEYGPPSWPVHVSFLAVGELPLILVEGATTIEPILSTGYISLPASGTSALVFDHIISAGSGSAGSTVYSFGRLPQIESNGYAEIVPYVYSECNIGEIMTQSLIIACVFGSYSNMEFSSGIIHQKGRVLFGETVPPLYREIYELSNNRSVEIRSYPEDCKYPIFIPDTLHDLTDQELRIGTIAFGIGFAHDANDIDFIYVWVTGPDGHSYKVTTLRAPFRDHIQLTIPIHCITNKANQFHLEIVYNNPLPIANLERYLIPFQPHFDHRNPYASILDQFVLGSGHGGLNNFGHSYDENARIFSTNDDAPNDRSGANATNNLNFSRTSDEFSRTFQIFYDVPNDRGGVNATGFINFGYITDNLGSIQIGG